MKKLYLLAAFWLLHGLAIAQSDTSFVAQTQVEYDSVFSTLNWNNIPTGILLNKTILFSNYNGYTGKDNELSGYQDWRQMYLEYYNASANRDNILLLEDIKASTATLLESEHKIPLLFLHYKYNQFVPDALANSLITIDTVAGRVYDQSGTNLLYDQGIVFTVAQPAQQHNGEEVTFFIGRDFWFGNIEAPDHLEIDFGDGQGFQQVDWDSEVTINYGTDFTPKEILIRLQANDAEGFEELTARTSLLRTNISPPDLIYGLKASNAWDGKYAKALAYVSWGNNNAAGPAQGKFCKPLIFVEGIDFQTNCANSKCNVWYPTANGVIDPNDPTFRWHVNLSGYRNGDTGWDEMVNYNPDIKSLEKLPTLRTDLVNQGYDVIFLDFSDGSALIQENAMVLIELLNWVNSNTICNDEVVVAGASMGGQVARFALSLMEQNNQCHNTKLYISFDSPHKGANVPLGYQYMVADLAKFADAAEDNKRNLLRPASKQMLLLHFDDAAAAPLRNAWQAWQASPNSYPQNLRKVAIANGSKIAKTHPVQAGSEIIETTTGGNAVFSAEMECTSLKGKTRAGRNNVIYFRGRNGILKKNLFITANNNWPEYDTAPGCAYPFGRKMKDGDKFSLGGINIPTTTLNLHKDQDFSTFMPTISTLDVKAAYGSSNLLNNVNLGYNVDANVDDDAPEPTKYAFDAYYAPDDNEPHVQITDGSTGKYKDGKNYGSDNIGWITKQLQLVNALQPNQLANLFNFGSSANNRLKTITVQSGGELYVNKNAQVSGITPAVQAQAGTFQLNTIPGCPVNVQLNTGGKMVLGDDVNNGYKAEVFFRNNSTLNLNGGKLVIHDGSRLVIEAGATLLLSQNSIIELNGDNAVLEIKGNLSLANGVTFTFTTIPGQNTGYVKFNRGGTQLITTGLNSRIELIGQGITDKIMEITQNTRVNYDNWNNVAEIRILSGLVNMGQNSTLYLVKNPQIEGVHFSGSTSARYNDVECHGLTNRIKNCQFNGGNFGLTIFQNSGDQSLLKNNSFINNTTGLRTHYGRIKLESSQLTNNTTGWQMDAGGASEVNSGIFSNYNVNIHYASTTGGSLNLVQSQVKNSVTGVILDGAGTLRGNCTYVTDNATGAEIKNNAYVDFSNAGGLVPGMVFNNLNHNLVFTDGAGLNFDNGQNMFNTNSTNYGTKATTDGSAGISGFLIASIPGMKFYANKNSWNLKTPAAPQKGIWDPPYVGYPWERFDYRLFTLNGGMGGNAPKYYFDIIDTSPIARRTAQQQEYFCGAATEPGGGGGNSRMAQNTTSGSGTYNPAFTGTSQCTQYQSLLQAVQQASGLRTRSNPNGNDYLAFTAIQSALQLVQPDTCREFNELLGQAYRLMHETYTASLATDTIVTAYNKLNLANQVTDVFLNWSQQRADTSGMYYIWMDKALNSYAADELQKVDWALNNAWNYANNTNSGYVQYWSCLLNARQQLNDSTITATEFFALIDSCQNTYGNSGMASRTSQPVQVQSPLKLYPNPAEDKTVVNFDLKQAEPVTIELLDINGTVLERIRQDETRTGKQEVNMPLGNRKTGIYFIRVYGKNFNQSGRLSIVK